MKEEPLPSLSIVIPALNAESTIENCLESVFDQKYPGGFDITIAVGPSTDKTLPLLKSMESRHENLKIINNPDGLTSTALNLAIQASVGEIVARVDAQSILPQNYLKQAVSTLIRTGASNVGGVQHPIGKSRLQKIIATAMKSSFGSGPAKFRKSGKEGPADTVYLGTFTRKSLEEIGGFNNSLVRNQDYELNWRLRQAGHIVWLDPKLEVEYSPRTTFKNLASQYAQYGIWKRKMLLQNPRSTKLRQVASPLLVLGTLASIPLLVMSNFFGLIIPLTYLAALNISSLRTLESFNLIDHILLISAFVTMHFAWGTGFLFFPAKTPPIPQN